MSTPIIHLSLAGLESLHRLPLQVVKMPLGEHPENELHDHDFTELVLVSKGEATYHTGGQSTEIHEGDILMTYSGMSHYYTNTGNMEIYNLLYNAEELPLPLLDAYEMPHFERLIPAHSSQKKTQWDLLHPITHLAPAKRLQLIRLLDQMREELEGADSKGGVVFHSLALFMDALVLISRNMPTSVVQRMESPSLNTVIGYMKTHFQQPLSTEILAKKCHLSDRTFFRRFRQEVGVTPHQYLMQLRLNYAIHLLRDTDASISMIASEAGFFDCAHFDSRFQAEYNISPKDFREQNKLRIFTGKVNPIK